MDRDAFRSSPGRLVTGIRTDAGMKGEPEYEYFVPPPIPRRLDLSQDTLFTLAEASHQTGILYPMDRLLPNPHLLIRPYLRKEAVLSSRIEGTQASLRDILREEAEAAPPDPAPDTQEVLNYVHALEHGLTAIQRNALDLDLLRELHGILLTGVRGHDKHPGRFRDYQNWIGPPGTDLPQASYVPPAPHEMSACLDDLSDYLTDPPQVPLLIQAGLLHYQFEAIHPFGDGNGRVGRLLIMLHLVKKDVLRAPLLFPSAYFERHRTRYYDHLLRASTEGDLDGWLRFFLTGIDVQAREAAGKTIQIADLHRRYRDALQSLNATAHSFSLLDQVFGNPYVTIPLAARRLAVSFPTAQRAIEKYLVNAGVLTEVTGNDRNRMFVAQEVLAIIDD